MFSQRLTKKVGVIEVQYIGHYYLMDESYEVTTKKSNRKNRPNTRFFLNANGKLLKKVTYGKHHNTDLRLVDNINIYNYDNDKLIDIIKYESDYQKSIYPLLKESFIYNEKDLLVRELMQFYHDSSRVNEIKYTYDQHFNCIKKILDTGYYYQSEYDNKNRLKTYSQIFSNKLRWKWTYTYTKSQRIGIFQTFYKEDNYSKKEIWTFNKKQQLIAQENMYLSKNSLREKVLLFYRTNGLLKRIERYESYNDKDNYELTAYTDIVVKSKVRINKKLVKKINEL